MTQKHPSHVQNGESERSLQQEGYFFLNPSAEVRYLLQISLLLNRLCPWILTAITILTFPIFL